MNENDEGGSKAEEAEDAEKSKIKGLEMSTGKKIENPPKAGVFNEEDWEFGKDSKVEGENPEQELVGGVTSRIKLFENVEAPKAQRVFKKPLRVLKRQESEEEKRNQKLMGEAFNIGPGAATQGLDQKLRWQEEKRGYLWGIYSKTKLTEDRF